MLPRGDLLRDFASFTEEQRTLVTRLLVTNRMQLAFAPASDLLVTHAGVTVEDLQRAGWMTRIRWRRRCGGRAQPALQSTVTQWSVTAAR